MAATSFGLDDAVKTGTGMALNSRLREPILEAVTEDPEVRRVLQGDHGGESGRGKLLVKALAAFFVMIALLYISTRRVRSAN